MDEARGKAMNFIRTSIPEEYDFLLGIGAFSSGIRLTAPHPWAGIVFLRNTRPDEVAAVAPGAQVGWKGELMFRLSRDEHVGPTLHPAAEGLVFDAPLCTRNDRKTGRSVPRTIERQVDLYQA